MKLNLSVFFPMRDQFSPLVFLQVSHVLAAGRQLAVGPEEWGLQFIFPFSQFLFFLPLRLRLFSDVDRQIMRLEMNQYGKPLRLPSAISRDGALWQGFIACSLRPIGWHH